MKERKLILYRTEDAAKWLREAGVEIQTSTLQDWRLKPGKGPKSVKIVGRVYYRETDLEDWLWSQIEDAL